jgi:predicted Zn-dependent peptidase
MPRTAAPQFAIHRAVLENGLRVVLAPDRSAPVVAVAVHYDVGFRSEPEGSTGFAHLFEHMMFQGSEHVDKMEHAQLVQANGGTLNGSTTPDYTNYFEVLPSGALELALFLEADRMRSVRITRENLDNQISVVKEEIRVNVLNRPYGGFPWINLADVMFDTFANSHNGYGSFVDLESATLDDAADFFARYYAPGNAVLTIVGDFEADDAVDLVERHFGDIPGRRVPRHGSFAEPLPTGPRRGTHRDPHAPTPAAALGYRVPDPVNEVAESTALAVASALLTDGEASRLQQRLVRDLGLVTGVQSWLGTFGGAVVPFERDPTRFQILVFYPDSRLLDQIVDAVDSEIARLIADPGTERLDEVIARATSTYLRSADSFMSRALAISPFELFWGRAELINELPTILADVTPEAVSEAAARWLDPTRRVTLELLPGEPA